MDSRRSENTLKSLLCINGEEMEIMQNINYLGVHITNDLTWSLNISYLVNFERSKIKSILCQCVIPAAQ